VQKPPTGTVTQAEFAAFMRAYQDMVYSTAVRLTASDAHAEDIAQEVFLKAYAQFAMLRDNPAAGGWLRTVATNLSLNHLSRYRKRWRFFSELANEDESGETIDLLLRPDRARDGLLEDLAAGHRAARIEAHLAALPDHQRVPIVLFHFEGLPYEDIAALLGVSIAKLKTDLHRGRAELARRCLKEGLDR
jgi:RNA polymerase sigma-70 factor (ECF subfamily)